MLPTTSISGKAAEAEPRATAVASNELKSIASEKADAGKRWKRKRKKRRKPSRREAAAPAVIYARNGKHSLNGWVQKFSREHLQRPFSGNAKHHACSMSQAAHHTATGQNARFYLKSVW